MIGMNRKTSVTSLFLMAIAFGYSAVLPAEAEAQDHNHRGYHPLRHKQGYSYREHYQPAPHFPRTGHGYSKPRPEPRDTPCTCPKTEFTVVEELKSFQEHWIAASLMGCTLATASDDYELAALKQVAVDFGIDNPSDPGLDALLYIGLAREGDVDDPTDGEPGGPWGWIDGCTRYTENVFARDPTNVRAPNVAVGVIAFDNVELTRPGDIADFSPARTFGAMFECCIVKKSYRPQKYVLGSPHNTNKKLVHMYSP